MESAKKRYQNGITHRAFHFRLLRFFIKIQSQIVISKFIYLKAVLFVFFVIEGFQLVNSKLMKFVEIVPPFPARAKLVGKIRIRDITCCLRSSLDQPFKVLDQYKKFNGSEVEVVLKKGGKLKGVLSGYNAEGIEITTSKMVKKEGFKKKVQEDTVTAYTFAEVKSCKPVIKFK